MSALGQKQTYALQNVMSALHPKACAVQLAMSAMGQKRTSRADMTVFSMSAFAVAIGCKADMAYCGAHVCF